VSDQPKGINVQELDPNMKPPEPQTESIKWYSPLEAPFRIAGFAWLEQEGLYRRMPQSPSHLLSHGVQSLANCTAGGQVKFRTSSPKLFVKVVLAGIANMYHMPATGQCGFDCYIGEPGEQKYISTTRYDPNQIEFSAPLFEWSNAGSEMRMITLNFPLYQGVKELQIGLTSDAEVAGPAPFADDRKVIVYGTSITQGGCASRPGMCFTNILSRSIPREFINVGFSGNGRGEPEVAHVLAQIERPALLVLDYEGNAGQPEQYQQTLPAFIRIYRERHATVPILVISKIRFAKERFDPVLAQLAEDRKQIARETVAAFADAGDQHIVFFDGSTLLGEDYEECTVDGGHPTDLGFVRMAEGLAPTFRQLLK
jgi:hypothetical protein